MKCDKLFSGGNLLILKLLVVIALLPAGKLFPQMRSELEGLDKREVTGHQADRWYFGNLAALDFRQQDPVSDPSNIWLNVPTSPAIISDSMGEILFFTDGTKVYNKLGQIMPNGEGLHGFVGYSMPVMIVPKPGGDEIYYIFSTHRPKMNPNDPETVYGLEYNEVNMAMDNGYGDLTMKNEMLLPPEVSSKLTGIMHSNGTDYWVVAHKFNSNHFCSFLVNANGINPNYITSSVGIVHAGPGETNNAIGYMKISPDGTKLALAVHGSDVLEIYDFNAGTGQVTNAVTSPATFDEAYGIEFSPDSRYLYATTISTALPQPQNTPPSYLFQFDISVGNALFNPGNFDTIATDTLGSYFGGIQLGNDGRIYVSRSPYGNAALSVIQNPTRPGAECNFTAGAIDLSPGESRYGFPNFIQSSFNLPVFEMEYTGGSDMVTFTLQNYSNIDNVFWDFGDPGSDQNTSTDLQPTHTFSGPGTYQVSVTEFFNGMAFGPYVEAINVIYNEINENAPVQFCNIYPNPGDGNIRILFYRALKEATINLRNLAGQKIIESITLFNLDENEEVLINPGDLPDGFYNIDIRKDNRVLYTSKYLLKR